MKRAVQTRSRKTLETVLAAAEALVASKGVKSLTMDAVAAQAGVSKGAVLHHFRSKDALIAGMVSRQLEAIRAGRRSEAEELPDRQNRALLAVLAQSSKRFRDEVGFPPALMVAAIENSECLGEIRAYGDDTFRQIRADSTAPEESTVLGYAALGVLLSRALGFATLDHEDGARLFATMELMARRL